jgi:hypothetical protein
MLQFWRQVIFAIRDAENEDDMGLSRMGRSLGNILRRRLKIFPNWGLFTSSRNVVGKANKPKMKLKEDCSHPNFTSITGI